MHLQKKSISISLRSPHKLTQVETFCFWSILWMFKDHSTQGFSRLIDKIDFIGPYNLVTTCLVQCISGMNLTYFCQNRLKEKYALHRVCPFPNKLWFLRVCRTNILKTLWEKEKLLETGLVLKSLKFVVLERVENPSTYFQELVL